MAVSPGPGLWETLLTTGPPGDLQVSELHFVVDIEPTNRCNADCHFCPRDMTPHQGLMSIEVFEQALFRAGELKQLGRVTVNLCGLGEPLLNKHAPGDGAPDPRRGFQCRDVLERLVAEREEGTSAGRRRPAEDLHQRRGHQRRLRRGLQASVREDPRQHPSFHRDVAGRHRGAHRPRRLPQGQEPPEGHALLLGGLRRQELHGVRDHQPRRRAVRRPHAVRAVPGARRGHLDAHGCEQRRPTGLRRAVQLLFHRLRRQVLPVLLGLDQGSSRSATCSTTRRSR